MTWDQIIVPLTALVGSVGGFYLGFRNYRRAVRVDQVSEASGVATESRAGTAQIIDGLLAQVAGLNALLDQVQEEFREYRVEFKDMRNELRGCRLEIVSLREQLERKND